MRHVKTIILFAICIITTALPVQDDHALQTTKEESNSYRLPNNTAPIHYDIELIVDIIENFTYDGEVAIKFKVLEETSCVKLHSRNLMLNNSSIQLTFENGTTIQAILYDHDYEKDIVMIHFDTLLEKGLYILSLKFSGIMNYYRLSGIFRESYINEKGDETWLASTQFEPISAREAFPCWDEPALKATFHVSIKHHPNYTAIGNMPVREKSNIDETDGRVWTRFETTPIMSAYIIAFTVSDFEYISNAEGTIRSWSRKQMIPHIRFAHDIAQKAATILEHYTNSTVRVPKMDHVALPKHSAGAMENWGMISYSENSFVYKEGKSNYQRKVRIIETVIHELAHQWFGNLVSPTWWTHLWLNEGFASYFHNYIMDKICQEWRIMDSFIIYNTQNTLHTDTKYHTFSVDEKITTSEEIEESFSNAVYVKAPSILHMLSNIVTPEVFRAGLIRYLNEHEYDSADSDCLWSALQSALDESDVPHDDFEIKEAMDTWIKQKRYPLIYVTRDYSAGTMTLTQKDFGQIDQHKHSDDKDRYKDESVQHEWWVPINYATETDPNFLNARPIRWLKPKENLTIDGIDSDDWVIVNKRQSGYYRVTYDDTNWKKIGAYLRSENFTKIDVLNRAQIISDLTELAIYDQIKPSIFIDVASYLSQETDYLPWHSMFEFFTHVPQILDLPWTAPIKNLILNSMENLIKDAGYEEHADDIPLTLKKRNKALMNACTFGHTECRQMATTKFMEHFDNPEENKISPNLKRWIYDNGMRWANESVWNRVFESWIKNPSEEIWSALSKTENPTLLTKFLNATLSNDTVLSKEQRDLGLHYVFNYPNSNTRLDFLIDFVEEHYDSFQKEGVPISFYELRTQEQIQKMKTINEKYNIYDESSISSKDWENRIQEVTYDEDVVRRWVQVIEK